MVGIRTKRGLVGEEGAGVVVGLLEGLLVPEDEGRCVVWGPFLFESVQRPVLKQNMNEREASAVSRTMSVSTSTQNMIVWCPVEHIERVDAATTLQSSSAREEVFHSPYICTTRRGTIKLTIPSRA